MNLDNPEPRLACVLLVESSARMAGEAIAELNDGLQRFQRDIREDPLAAKRVEVMVISFGGGVYSDPTFVEARDYSAPTLTAAGDSPMAEGLLTAFDALEAQQERYRDAGVDSYRGRWLIVMSNGAPTGDQQTTYSALSKLQEKQYRDALYVLPIGIGNNADLSLLSALSISRDAERLRDLASLAVFFWGNSDNDVPIVSRSDPTWSAPSAAARTPLPSSMGTVRLPEPMGWVPTSDDPEDGRALAVPPTVPAPSEWWRA